MLSFSVIFLNLNKFQILSSSGFRGRKSWIHKTFRFQVLDGFIRYQRPWTQFASFLLNVCLFVTKNSYAVYWRINVRNLILDYVSPWLIYCHLCNYTSLFSYNLKTLLITETNLNKVFFIEKTTSNNFMVFNNILM